MGKATIRKVLGCRSRCLTLNFVISAVGFKYLFTKNIYLVQKDHLMVVFVEFRRFYMGLYSNVTNVVMLYIYGRVHKPLAEKPCFLDKKFSNVQNILYIGCADGTWLMVIFSALTAYPENFSLLSVKLTEKSQFFIR